MECWRYIVKGRVQGVGYRYATLRTAVSLGLRGWARNLENGDVEILAEGELSALESLRTWCFQGPPQSKVGAVEVTKGEKGEGLTDFSIRRDG